MRLTIKQLVSLLFRHLWTLSLSSLYITLKRWYNRRMLVLFQICSLVFAHTSYNFNNTCDCIIWSFQDFYIPASPLLVFQLEQRSEMQMACPALHPLCNPNRTLINLRDHLTSYCDPVLHPCCVFHSCIRIHSPQKASSNNPKI